MIKEGDTLLLISSSFQKAEQVIVIRELGPGFVRFSIVGVDRVTYNWSLDHFKTKVQELSSLHKELL